MTPVDPGSDDLRAEFRSSVREVLRYVGFSSEALVSKLRADVEAAVRNGRLDVEESGRLLQFYEEGLNGYTYLEERGPTR